MILKLIPTQITSGAIESDLKHSTECERNLLDSKLSIKAGVSNLVRQLLLLKYSLMSTKSARHDVPET